MNIKLKLSTTKGIIINSVMVVAMIIVNYLAVSLPLNNVTPGEVSDLFPTLFTPTGFTFAIWSLIYTGLISFIIYLFIGKRENISLLIKKINGWLFVSSIANILWIVCWHHYEFGWSILVMLTLLISLIILNIGLFKSCENTKITYIFYFIFNLYLGWICVATIANFAVYFSANDWNSFGLPNYFWASTMTIIATFIALILLFKIEGIAATISIIWGLYGIYYRLIQLKHQSYLLITLLICISVLVISSILKIILLMRSSKLFS